MMKIWMMSPRAASRVAVLSFSALIIARIATLHLSSFAPNGGFVEAWSALRARGMNTIGLPKVFGVMNWNTPPLHTWVLALFGHTFGWSEAVLRFPSVAAWALAAIPIARMSKNKLLAAGIWLTMPLPVYMAGRATPDMFLVLFIALFVEAYRRNDMLGMIGWFVLGVLTKQVMIIVLAPLFFQREYRRFILPLAAISLLTVPFVLTHLFAKGLGYWDWPGLVRALIGGSAGLALVCTRRDWRAYWMLPFIGFFLFAAPQLHDYYLLPVFPFVASLVADIVPDRKHAIGAILVGLIVSIGLLGYSGSLTDTRTRDMATGEPPMVAQNSLHAIAAWYYYTPIETWNGTQSGTVWGGLPYCGNSTHYPGPGVDLWVSHCGP